MRLWHEDLIPILPKQQLLGQHRECCALRGKGWNRPHATVNYVFQHSPYKLYQYHQVILAEMKGRSYKPDLIWTDPHYRGKNCKPYSALSSIPLTSPIYPEHDKAYRQVCLENLAKKGIFLSSDYEQISNK